MMKSNELQKSICEGLEDKSLEECLERGINPQGDSGGFLPDVPFGEIEEWAMRSYQAAVDASASEFPPLKVDGSPQHVIDKLIEALPPEEVEEYRKEMEDNE